MEKIHAADWLCREMDTGLWLESSDMGIRKLAHMKAKEIELK